ncbi:MULTISPECIES: bestrophin family protein [Chryseobacterium]|uniref:Membrane protein n=1 Tax=Chryseobacterium camelliae TaxID=1265445 RepID=A0ABU0TCY1_9FLAO|nr:MULTISPECIES: bestrophin family ion channel [Chryseobacterium]MDT3407277.1 putative membrane protein [Pseudacidovorax intermedius]MDQ1094933.1 putative membrane protein [Chryseobacterium camelliae]MDQ1098872.1 putative membrane protein [Chryseobacterium sp. SORGH_AS_1048]MDR6086222.1 putative membrane protein [Chryseobacterium sp. SORGH_AS_0909]MDR6130592.1 putative membrane protein [Chryseobacterium sp. SORGH_AS_1175]
MIIRQRVHWLKMLFIWKGSVLKKIMVQLAVITLFSLAIYYFKGKVLDYKVHLNPAIFTLIGLALAIFMGFCNSASYDRYWEGRKLWGVLVNETRSLTRQIFSFVNDQGPDAYEEKQKITKVIAAFCWSLNDYLRDKPGTHSLDHLLSKEQIRQLQGKKFIPNIILGFIADWLNDQHSKGNIDSIIMASMDERLNQFSTILGGCERIHNTPLPFAYSVLLHRTVYLYCFWLPFGLVDIVGWMMPLVVLLISYTFIALDAIIQEIGEPFGEEENDLALNSICRTIEYSIFEQAGIQQEQPVIVHSYVVD